jgi:predicted DNA-binding transcriptional regulator YafY
LLVVSRPATRLLAFLELLEGRPAITGAEAARELGVDARTIRRYVDALHELGIPVDGQRGAGGGYRLRPGYRMAPLMLDDDEATAVVAGLVATEGLGLAGAEPALAKVRRVLPAALRRRAEALESALAFGDRTGATVPPVGDTLLVLAAAARRHRRVAATYAPARGEPRRRELDPFGVVVHGGRWYVSARDAASGETRTFRADRFTGAVTLGEPTDPPPAGFDPVAAVARSLARVPYAWAVEVRLDAPVEHVRPRVPASIAELTSEPDGGCTLRMRSDSLRWTAEVLASLGCTFTINFPAELRAEVRAVAERLLAAAAEEGAADLAG